MEILGITLARGGSKSVVNKNIRPICGKPLIAFTIEEALKSNYINDYIVSSDSKEIMKTANKYGAKTPFIRPENLSSDTASSAAALQHAVYFMEDLHNKRYDYIVELMCTNPLKTVSDIDAIIKDIKTSKADSVIAVHQLEDHHPARIKKLNNGYIQDFCVEEPNEARRQDLTPKAYIRSGSIYCMKRDYLMNDGMRYGGKNSKGYVLPPERAINIDTKNDFMLAEIIISEL